MATIKKVFATVAVLVETAVYGGSAAVIAADQEYDYTTAVDHETSGYYGSHVTIEFTGSNSTDSLIVDVFAALDGATYDSEPFMHREVKSTGKPQQFSLIVEDVAHFRLGLRSSDTNTTFEHQVTYQSWNESSA